MENNSKLNALEALDVCVLLQAVPFETAFNCVADLIRYAFYAELTELDESQGISLDCHYTLTEEYKTIREGFDSLCSTLTQLQRALLQGIGLPCVIKKDERIDIKPMLWLLPYDKSLEIIDVCLEYVNEGIEFLNKDDEYIRILKGEMEGDMEELKATLIAIRKEEELLKLQSEESKGNEEYEDLPF